jgi:RNA polymerase subunit RPABC4/transcription elongation factor Spt4
MSRERDEPCACEHCGALVYPDTRKCAQCGHFPIKLHRCPRCRLISAKELERCPACGRLFEPDGDYL